MEHHTLDVHPIPKEKKPLYINEPWLIDDSYIWEVRGKSVDPDPEEDNIRVYIPLDPNSKAILRRAKKQSSWSENSSNCWKKSPMAVRKCFLLRSLIC